MTEPLPWRPIFNRVKSQIPAAPDALIRQEFWSVMLDFTSDTNIWQEDVPFTIHPNQVTYVVPVTDGQPWRLLLVYNDDPNNKDASRYRWADNNITMRIPGVIQLGRNPSQQANWIARIAKSVNTDQLDESVPPQPTGYPKIDAWIPSVWNDLIYYGVMYFLQRMPAKPFANKEAAADNGKEYASAKAIARGMVLRSNVFDGQAWTYPQTFATVTRKGWQ